MGEDARGRLFCTAGILLKLNANPESPASDPSPPLAFAVKTRLHSLQQATIGFPRVISRNRKSRSQLFIPRLFPNSPEAKPPLRTLRLIGRKPGTYFNSGDPNHSPPVKLGAAPARARLSALFAVPRLGSKLPTPQTRCMHE